MTIETRDIDYTCDGTLLQGRLAFDNDIAGPRPLVLTGHAWGGRGQFENDKAEALARLGYAGFAWDVYGKGISGGDAEQNRALMTPLVKDRAKLQRRLMAAVNVARSQDEADAAKTAAMGFCFGGLCALELARIGSDLLGVISFHGVLEPPANTIGTTIRARVLALHGWDDPMVPPEDVLALTRELTGAGADWQLHAYGNTMHAFTNPAANDPGFGTVYDAQADARSWRALENFLAEIFSPPIAT